jgi:hypothetical protein
MKQQFICLSLSKSFAKQYQEFITKNANPALLWSPLSELFLPLVQLKTEKSDEDIIQTVTPILEEHGPFTVTFHEVSNSLRPPFIHGIAPVADSAKDLAKDLLAQFPGSVIPHHKDLEILLGKADDIDVQYEVLWQNRIAGLFLIELVDQKAVIKHTFILD